MPAEYGGTRRTWRLDKMHIVAEFKADIIINIQAESPPDFRITNTEPHIEISTRHQS